MAVKKTTYIIEVDTKSGKVKIDGLTKGFVKAEDAVKRLNTTLKKTSTGLDKMTDKTGLAGAAVVEIGRTISDSNFGLTAMANNLSQLSTLMVTLIATTGGLKNAVSALWKVLKGPLGIIIVFQVVITLLEKLAIAERKAGKATNAVALAFKNAGTELEIFLKLDDSLTDNQRENTRIRIKLLKEEAKVRAQVAAIQKLQGELVELELKQIADFVPAYRAFWESIKSGDILKGGVTRSEGFLASVLGIGEESKEKQRAGIESKIADIMADIDVDAIRRITEEKGKSGKRGKDQKKLFGLDVFGLAGLSVPTPEEMNKALTGMSVELEIREQIRKEDAKNHDKWVKEQKRLDKEAFEHKMLMYDGIGQGLNALGFLMGEATQEGKAIAAAGALIDTYAAIAGILKNTARTPAGGIPGYAIAQAVGAGIFGFAQVKKIYDVKVPKSSGGAAGGGSSESIETQPPDFNIVGGSGINQLREAIVGELNKPNKVYITSKDVSTSAELERNIVSGATVG